MTGPAFLPVPMLPLGMLNAFILKTAQGAVLVDTGMPGSSAKAERVLREAGMTLADLRLIIVTHGHIDHAGSAARLARQSGAPVLLHEDDIPYCSGQVRAPLDPTGPFGRLFKKTGVAQRPYSAFRPDIIMQGSQPLDLGEFGLRGKVLHTPGHTPGSVSVLLGTGDALVGDLAASGILLGGIALRGRPKQPPFEEDSAAVARSLETLLEQGATRFFLGHGGPLPARAIRRHILALRRSGLSARPRAGAA